MSLSRRQNKFETAPPLGLNRPGPNFPRSTHLATPASRHEPSVGTGTGPGVAPHPRSNGGKQLHEPRPPQVNPATPAPGPGTSLPGSPAAAPADWLRKADFPGAGAESQPMTPEEGGHWSRRKVLRGRNAPCSKGRADGRGSSAEFGPFLLSRLAQFPLLSLL